MKKWMVPLFLLSSLPAFAEEWQIPYQKLEKSFFENPDPEASRWKDLPETMVALFPQNITTPGLAEATVSQAKVRAVHNGQWVAVRLEWPDATRDVNVETDLASDACAVQWPVGDFTKTSPFMGSKGFPVSIIHWKGIWQQDVDKGYQQVKDLYPNTWVDTYRFGQETAILAKNPVSQTERKNPVEQVVAEGFGTLTSYARQEAKGRGVWKNGSWQVVLVRKLKGAGKADAVLKPGTQSAIGFAIWEGGRKNVGGRKNYAPWMAVQLEKR